MSYAFVWMLVAAILFYEAYAVSTQVLDVRRWPTISEAVWAATARYPWLRWAGTALGVLLILHFWWGLW